MPNPLAAFALGALTGYSSYRKSGTMYRRSLRGRKSTYSNLTRLRRYQRGRRPRKRMTRRRWLAKQRREVGLPKNFSTAKTTESVLPNQVAINRNFVDIQAINRINKDTGNNDINTRQRDSVVISGIKLWLRFDNVSTQDLVVNWAIVSPKHSSFINNLTADFFRDYTASRAWDINSSAKTGLSWANAIINNDEFTVLRKGRFKLIPSEDPMAAEVAKSGTSYKSFRRWLPLQRTFTYSSGNDTADDTIYFVTWCAHERDAAGYNTGGGMLYRLKAVTYFREP